MPTRVIGDADRLRQILVNLAGNAVKLTDAGGVGVSVELTGAGEIAVLVQSTGPGISPDRLSSIFEEFEQGDGSASRSHAGTGLGLAMTRRIVEHMQGSIEVDSVVGQGTAFRVRLPLPPAESPPSPAPSLDGRRVLLLGRSPFEAPFLTRRLAESGAAVTHVTAPEEALATLVASRFDVLLVDRVMGDDLIR